MTTIKEKDFIRLFILELILVQKDSAFDLWDNETVILPNNYLLILDAITNDEIKKNEYQDLIPINNKEEWKSKINEDLNDFLKSTGVEFSYQDNNIRINLNREAISNILFDERFDYSQKGKVASLAEDFLIAKTSEKPKILINKQ